MQSVSDRDKTIQGYTVIVSCLAALTASASRGMPEIVWIFPLVGGCMIGVAQLADRNKSGFIISNPWLHSLIYSTITFPGLYHLLKETDSSPLRIALGIVAAITPVVLGFNLRARHRRNLNQPQAEMNDASEGPLSDTSPNRHYRTNKAD